MAENKNPFDAHFHRRLSDHESPIPDDLFDRLQARRGSAIPSDAPVRERLAAHETPVSDTLFDAVLAERERRKRRRVIFWRSATAIAALWLLGTFILTSKSKNSAEKNAELNASNSVKNDAINAELKIKNSELKDELITSNSIKKGENTEGSNSELKIKNLELKNELNASNSELINNKNLELKNELNASNSELINNKNAELNTSNLIKKGENTEGSNSELNASNSELKNELNNRLMGINSTTLSLNFLDIKTPKTIVFSANKNRKNPCSDPGNGCPTFGMRRRSMAGTAFYIDAFFSPEYANRTFATQLPESEKLRTARDTVEQTQYAISTGLRATLVLGNGLAFRTGLVYNQTNERAQFDSLGVGSTKTTYETRDLPTGQKDTFRITIETTDGIYRKTRYNYYRSLDIPLQIGYEIRQKGGWTFGFNAGVNINIASWQKADIVGSDLRQQSVSSGINAPNPVFKTQLGVNFIGSIAAYRQITNNLQFVIEPSMRYGLQPITRTDYALKQQYAMGGLIIGLRLRL